MHPLLAGLKVVAEKALFKKVAKEVNRGFKNIQKSVANDDNEVIELTGVVEATQLSKGKVSAWLSVIVAGVYAASSAGYITPEIAMLIDSLLSNPDAVQGIEEAIE